MHKHYICLPVNTSHTIRLMPMFRCVHKDNTQVRVSHTIRQVILFYTRRLLTILRCIQQQHANYRSLFPFFLMLSHHGISRFSVSFFLVADVSSHRRSVLTSGGLMGGGYFCGCFWHFSADVLHSVGRVPVTAGDSRSWCQEFSLGACIL
jgi:hypothetical protein